MRRAIIGCGIICILAMLADASPAALMLKFESDGDVLEVDDLATPGSIALILPSFVGDFEVSFTFAQIIGGAPGPLGSDLYIDVTSLAAGTITVKLTATGLDIGRPVTILTSYLGGFSSPGVAPDAISFSAGFDDNNDPYVLPASSTIAPVLVGGTNYMAPTQSLAVSGSGPFSLTQSIVITADQMNQQVSFSSGVEASGTQAVPEPATLAAWAGLLSLGLCVAGRRRGKSVA